MVAAMERPSAHRIERHPEPFAQSVSGVQPGPMTYILFGYTRRPANAQSTLASLGSLLRKTYDVNSSQGCVELLQVHVEDKNVQGNLIILLLN